jgi:hypothetical protein
MNAAQDFRPEAAIIVANVMMFGLAMIWVAAHYIYLGIKQWQATTLVREMVARGYTAQEIIHVCQSLGHKRKRLPDTKGLPDVPPAKPVQQPAFSP